MTTPFAVRVLERNARVYRHVWKGSVVTSFVNPVLFLLAMGLGLGTLVDRAGGADLPGSGYLAFLAPGLIAASAMQTGAGDASWPVLGGFKWVKHYYAALSTPLRPQDLVLGHLGWVMVRLSMVTLAFAAVMVAFGATPAAGGFVAVLPSVLCGLAYAAAVTAYSATLEDATGLSALFRFGIVPMFLFSGTFFPVSQLPDWLEPLAYVVPLWHGVELSRGAALGLSPALAPWIHAGYLAAWVAVGTLVAQRNFRRRLVV